MQYLSAQDKLLIGLIFYSPAIMAFVFGTVIGSLSNVIIYRMVYYKSIWSPPSHCTSCGTEIPGYLNIPIISYLVLRGRCRSCGAKFSSQYFWVELASGVMYALVVLWVYTLPPPQGLGIRFMDVISFRFTESPSLGFPPHWSGMLMMLKGFIFSTLLLILTVTDFDHHLLPDRLTIPGIGLGLLLSVVAPLNRPELASFGTHGIADAILQSVLGLIVGGGIIFLLAWISYKILKIPGMGEGDIFLLGMIGSFIGIKALGPSILIGIVAGGLVAFPILAFGLLGNLINKSGEKKYVPFRTYMPFGPFLVLGGFLGFFWGHMVFTWYIKYILAGGVASANAIRSGWTGSLPGKSSG